MSDDQGPQLYALAEKKLKRSLFKRPDIDGAIDCFEKAGNYFKIGKNYSRAGESYSRAAQLYIDSQKPQLAINPLNNAINCYNLVDPQMASSLVEKLITTCMSTGRFVQAGKVTRELAEKAEEREEWEQAYALFKRALEVFQTEPGAESEARNCKLKVADIGAAKFQKWEESAKIYEDVAAECVRIKLLQFHARGYLLRAFLCICMLNDSVALSEAVQRFMALDPSLPDSPEADFMNEASAALAEKSQEQFLQAQGKYTQRALASVRGNYMIAAAFAAIADSIEGDEADEDNIL